jgi:urease accessory protein
MNDVGFYTPDDIPDEVAKYDDCTEVRQQGTTGKVGRNGLLQVVFERRGGKTIVSEQMCQSPLYFQRAMYFEQSAQSLAHMYMMSSAGGILQRDRHRVDITLKENSAVHVTTQGATRIYGMEHGNATQMINITLGENAYLEFLSDQIIPYRNSRYYQRLGCTIHDSAVMVYSEIITPGRMAMNEAFEYDVCYVKSVVKNQDDRLRFVDVLGMMPKDQYGMVMMKVLGVLDRFDIMGNVYVFAKKDQIVSIMEKIGRMGGGEDKIKKDVMFGTSMMAYEQGIMIRVLGNEIQSIQDLILQIVKIVRREVIDASFDCVRKT